MFELWTRSFLKLEKLYGYYKIVGTRLEYKGERYFKMDIHGDRVIQVCKSTGESKKGRAHVFGIYLISKMTFASNYLSMGYTVPCTKKEFERNFENVLKLLR